MLFCRLGRSLRRRYLIPLNEKPAGEPDIVPVRALEGEGATRFGASDETRVEDLLEPLRSGQREALDRITALLYDELREIARRHRRARDNASSLATTALVHEAYLKLVDQSQATWNDRAHFLALAAIAMRHILIDRAKARVASKRGGARVAITLEEELIAAEDQPDALLQIDDALRRLEQVDARLARILECRFFGGLTNEEIARALGVTVRTVERGWVKARMLLRDELAT
jgi:RNA polymerase sigma factor (TIGR02999 family)